jgi:hypothetical protein
VSTGLRVAGNLLRGLFIATLLVVIARITLPQSQSIWFAYEPPGDLIRTSLGFVVGLLLLLYIFMFPKDAKSYRNWLYLGLLAAPFALALVVWIW